MRSSEWRSRLQLELDRDAVRAVWNEKMAALPATFARLIYLASLRDVNNGRYSEPSLVEQFGAEETDKALRVCHEIVFGQWLCYRLHEQQADLELYLSALRDNKRTVLKTWLHLEPYRGLAPESAREEEKRLYVFELETSLRLLKSKFAVPSAENE